MSKSYVDYLCAAVKSGTHNGGGYRFSGIRCKAGPTYKGKQSLLVYVTIEHKHKTVIGLVWETVDGTVINSGRVPSYSYIPSDVRAAASTTKFRA